MEGTTAVQTTLVDSGALITRLHAAYALIDPVCLLLAQRVAGYAATRTIAPEARYLVQTSRTIITHQAFYRSLVPLEPTIRRARARTLGIEPTILYLQLLSDQLESFLAGEQTGSQIIRVAGAELWERYNDDNLIASFLADAVADAVSMQFLRSGAHYTTILELGGGVGATTRRLAPMLGQIELLFTDIKPHFLARARERFSPQLKTRMLDINAPERLLAAVGGQRFQIIYATNVLHCAYDPVATLIALRRCLLPGGTIVLGEGTLPTINPDGPPWPLDVLFSLFPGWWDIPPSLMRLRPGFQTPGQWCQVLGAAGYTSIDVTLYADERQYGAVYCARSA